MGGEPRPAGGLWLGLTSKTNAFISLPCFLLRPGAEGTCPLCFLRFLALLTVCVWILMSSLGALGFLRGRGAVAGRLGSMGQGWSLWALRPPPSLPLLQVFIELNHIKKCNTVRGVFVLEEFGNYTILLLGLDSHGSNSNLGAPEEGLGAGTKGSAERSGGAGGPGTKRSPEKTEGKDGDRVASGPRRAGSLGQLESRDASDVVPSFLVRPASGQKVLGQSRLVTLELCRVHVACCHLSRSPTVFHPASLAPLWSHLASEEGMRHPRQTQLRPAKPSGPQRQKGQACLEAGSSVPRQALRSPRQALRSGVVGPGPGALSSCCVFASFFCALIAAMKTFVLQQVK